MAFIEMTKNRGEYAEGNSSIVVIKELADLPAGRTIDVSDITEDVVRAGHVIIQNTTTKEVKALGVTSGAYNSLPSGWAYLGVTKVDFLKTDPRTGILTMGQVNGAASPYPVTSAIKTALSNIQFLYI